MKRLINWVAISIFSLLILGLPAIASAQYGGGGQYDPYGRNGGNNNGGYNNGGYGNGGYGNYRDIRSTLRDLKNRSKDFKREVDRNNGGIFGGYNRNNDRYLKDLAGQFKKASDRLESHYKNGNDQYRSADEARQVLDLGSQLEQEMYRGRSNGNLQGYWGPIRSDLEVVANTYGYNNNYNNNRGNRGNRYPQGGNNRRPSWWPF